MKLFMINIFFIPNRLADTSHWVCEIDQLVYKLYNLTEEEINIVEEG